MEALDYAIAVRDDPNIKALPWRDQVAERENIWNDYVARDQGSFDKYGQDGLDDIKKSFLTTVPDEIKGHALRNGNREEITPELADAWKEGYLNVARIEDINTVRSGEKPTDFDTRNFGTGFTRAFSNIDLMGKLGRKLVEAGIGDQVYTGEDTMAVEDYRDYVNKVYDNKDIGYNIGRGIGGAAAVAGQLVGFHKLLGSVEAGGALTSGLQKAVQASMANEGAIARHVVPLLVQGAVEVPVGLAYNAAHDILDGRKQDLFTTPGKELLSEVGFFVMGEGLGHILGTLGGLRQVYSAKRFKNTMDFVSFTDGAQKVGDDFMDLVTGKTGTLNEDSIKWLNMADSSGEAVKTLNEANTAVRTMFANAENPAEAVQELLYKTLYKMDTKINPDTGAITIKSIDGKAINKTFKAQDAKFIDFLQTKVTEAKNTKFDEIAVDWGRRHSMVTIGVRGKSGFKASKLSFDDVSKTLVPADGVVDSARVKSFLETQLGLKDIPEVKVIDDFFKADVTFDGKSIKIPTNVDNPEQVRRFTESLFEQIKKANPKFKISYNRFAKYLTKIASFAKYDDQVLKAIPGVTGLKNVDGKIELDFNGNHLTFDSIEEAGSVLHSSFMTDSDLAVYLTKQHNMAMSLADDGTYRVYDNAGTKAKPSPKGDPLYEFETVDEFFRSVPQLRPPLPVKMGPDTLILSPAGVRSGEITLDSQTFSGTADQAAKFLKKFNNNADYDSIKVLENGTEIKEVPNPLKYEIEYGDSGIKFATDSLDEAKHYSGADLDSFDGLELLARQKGYHLEITNGGYHSVDMEGNRNFFRSRTELKSFLAEKQSLTNLQELFDLDPSVTKSISEAIGDPVTKTQTKLGSIIKQYSQKFHDTAIGQSSASFFETTAGRLERINDKETLDLFHRLRDSQSLYHSTMADYRKQLYKMYGGMDSFNRRRLGQVMIAAEKDGLEFQDAAKSLDMNLSKKEYEVLVQSRRMLDALGTRYGVSSSMWIKNYFPHMKQINPNEFLKRDFDSRKLMNDAFGQGTNADYVPFFDHVRMEDLAGASFNDDILSIVETYAKVGERKMFFGNTIKDVNLKIEKLDSIADSESLKILQHTRDQVSGKVYSDAHAQRAASKIISNRKAADAALKSGRYKTNREAVNAADAIMRRDMTEMANDLITSNLMSMKLRLPLRNTLQIYGTTGALTGNSAVLKAQHRVTENFDKIYAKHKARGITMVRDPLDPTRSLMKRWLKGANSVGMNIFRTSDDYTRLVTAEAWDIMFTDSLELMTKGKIGYEQFSKLTWSKLLDPADLERFDKFMKQGQHELANSLLSDRMTKLTIFDYDVLNKPEAWTSGIGRIAGQYQTYPLQYIRMVKKIVAASDVQERAVYIGRLLFNTATVGYTLHDVLGMKGAPMTPMGTMSISGGPGISAMIQAFTAMTANNTSIGSKIKAVGRAGKIFIPFGGQETHVWKAVKAYLDGEAMAATVHLAGGTPIDEKWIDTDQDVFMMGGLEAIYGKANAGFANEKTELRDY